jgi:hypothetical protein
VSDDRLCTATTARGRLCCNYVMPGTDVCWTHTPNRDYSYLKACGYPQPGHPLGNKCRNGAAGCHHRRQWPLLELREAIEWEPTGAEVLALAGWLRVAGGADALRALALVHR